MFRSLFQIWPGLEWESQEVEQISLLHQNFVYLSLKAYASIELSPKTIGRSQDSDLILIV